jgi:hypothetical protein
MLSMPVVKQRINIRYKQILGAEDWEFLKDRTTVKLEGQYSNTTTVDTVAVTHDSTAVVGTGTTFTKFTVGDFIRFDGESQPYEISVITSATSLTLLTAYGGATDLVSDYDVFRLYYSPSVADVGEIVSIIYQGRLKEVSENYLNAIDPERSSTGAPTHYRVVSKTKGDGIVTFEPWPIPDQDYVVTIHYKKRVADLSADTDEPVFRPELIEAGALWDCYRLVFTITQNPAFIGMARDAKMDYANLLRDAIIEDIGTTSMPRRVKDVSGGPSYNDEFMLNHDTEGI